MQIEKSNKVEDVGLMDEKLQQMGNELADLRIKELVKKEQLQLENKRLREKL